MHKPKSSVEMLKTSGYFEKVFNLQSSEPNVLCYKVMDQTTDIAINLDQINLNLRLGQDLLTQNPVVKPYKWFHSSKSAGNTKGMHVLEGIAIAAPTVAFLSFRFFNTGESAILRAPRIFAFRAFDIFISFSSFSSCVLGSE